VGQWDGGTVTVGRCDGGTVGRWDGSGNTPTTAADNAKMDSCCMDLSACERETKYSCPMGTTHVGSFRGRVRKLC
jgi:hypothetical protein